MIANSAATTIMATIKKNNTNVQVSVMEEYGEHTLSISDKLIDVQPGDVISVEAYVYGDNATIDGDSGGTPTYLTVKEVADEPFYAVLPLGITLNADGTTTPEITDGYYYIPAGKTLNYYDDTQTLVTDTKFTNAILYYNSTLNRFYLQVKSADGAMRYIYYGIARWSSTYWGPFSRDVNEYVYGLTSNTEVLDTIPASGNDNDVPSIKAVRDYIANILNT